MKIAIIGSGISGLYAAHYLQQEHDIYLYEANSYLGGHTDTHEISINDRQCSVDTGFIVFNTHNYPYFCRFLKDLNVSSQASDMTFSVCDISTGLEYNATTMDKLFCQRRNLFRPRFYRMVLDIIRFYKQAPALLKSNDVQLTLGDFLTQQHYSAAFIEDHILPMACALWSAPADTLKRFPMTYLVAFMHNHQMLQINSRPEWRTIIGGSNSYIKAFVRRFNGKILLNTPVRAVQRMQEQVSVSTKEGQAHYDKVIFACHSDQALKILSDPTGAEQEILGAINFEENDTVLHTDSRLMPRYPKAWASWNAIKLGDKRQRCTTTYYMNKLQNLDFPEPLLVSLNCTDLINPDKIIVRRTYHHPIYTPESLYAQRRKNELNSNNNIYFSGAYWGWGFHEDGAKSAQDVVELIQSDLCKSLKAA